MHAISTALRAGWPADLKTSKHLPKPSTLYLSEISMRPSASHDHPLSETSRVRRIRFCRGGRHAEAEVVNATDLSLVEVPSKRHRWKDTKFMAWLVSLRPSPSWDPPPWSTIQHPSATQRRTPFGRAIVGDRGVTGAAAQSGEKRGEARGQILFCDSATQIGRRKAPRRR